MLLSQGKIDHTYQVSHLIGRDKIQMQMMNMGIVPGASIRIVNHMHKNIIIGLRQSRLGIGRELAEKIEVTELAG